MNQNPDNGDKMESRDESEPVQVGKDPNENVENPGTDNFSEEVGKQTTENTIDRNDPTEEAITDESESGGYDSDTPGMEEAKESGKSLEEMTLAEATGTDGIDIAALEASGLFDDAPGSGPGVTAQPARFPEFDDPGQSGNKAEIDMLLDISLPLVVELGRTNMLIEEILSIKSGTVITLDKMNGEPANLVINGKVMARGEIVVIDENFGIRITGLVKQMDRLKEKH